MAASDDRLKEAKRKKASPAMKKVYKSEWIDQKKRLEHAAAMVVALQADLDLNIYQPLSVELKMRNH
jgi:hypothetical protein